MIDLAYGITLLHMKSVSRRNAISEVLLYFVIVCQDQWSSHCYPVLVSFLLFRECHLHYFFFLPFCFWYDNKLNESVSCAISTFNGLCWLTGIGCGLGAFCLNLGMGLLTETNCNFNWKESLWGNRIAQLLHVEQSSAIKLLRALLRTA